MMELFRLDKHRLLTLTMIVSLLYQNLSFCFSLNDEGFSLLRFRDRVVNDPFVALNIVNSGVKSHRKLLQTNENENIPVPTPPQFSLFPFTPLTPTPLPPSPSPSPLLPPAGAPLASPSPSPSPSPSNLPNIPLASSPSTTPEPPPSSNPANPTSVNRNSSSNNSNRRVLIISSVIGASAFIGIVALLLWRSNKVATVRPWATGLSGQLQKAFVTGVPKLKRSELEAACEDFSNVIGSTSLGIIYKGTLSSGVEIAVASVAPPSAKDWSKHLETMFRKRIDMLSKVNHKNFVNLLGYCEEEVPFTRMIAFEYAPNGTLFEHLHIQEAEHLDWGMRMRIAMGMSYCLDYMHQLAPPVSHKNLNSSSINLTEDYAAKISDFALCNDSTAITTEPTPESNVYNLGIILFEMITGRIPYAGTDSIDDWALDFLKGENPMTELVDPTLDSYDADQLEAIGKVIRSCVNSDIKKRPKMRDITIMLKEITRIAQEGATPKISPLWWAELEILSTEAT